MKRREDDAAKIQKTPGAEWQAAEIKKQIIREKLLDAQVPGFQAEFDPIEAEQLGAFIEDSLSEQDARDSSGDYLSAEDEDDG